MGRGKDLFGHYNDLGKEMGPGSDEHDYAGVLFQSLLILGERKTFELLEEADQSGKRLQLEYPVIATGDDQVPHGVKLA